MLFRIVVIVIIRLHVGGKVGCEIERIVPWPAASPDGLTAIAPPPLEGEDRRWPRGEGDAGELGCDGELRPKGLRCEHRRTRRYLGRGCDGESRFGMRQTDLSS